ncbi:MAG TPA: hypothetical protein VHR55_09155 [Candidatus Limnocylindria bacterium]|nr:hypothetical protein [Candidatus Limnocylindria bacterium]
MKTPIRTTLVLALLAIAGAACGTATGANEPSAPATPSQPASDPVSQPAQPSMAPSEDPAPQERVVVGTVTVAEMAFSGPGATIAEAIAHGNDEGDLPSLVNGVLFRDADGTVYLASAITDADAPTFDGPMLEVLNMDSDGPSWDMANAELLGLEEANGIVFQRDAQVLGFIELR